MGINLALSRITRLLLVLGNPHISYKSIHIAGTNGKGSTVAYISSILSQANICNGRFTSPHLLYYNDCISINNETYPVSKFLEVSDLVKKQDKDHDIGCTEFELLTVTAFKIFELERVDVAVIEVGLGGRLDATNVLLPKKTGPNGGGGVVACGITKIGIDHEKFLGSTVGKIAAEKAGIIKPEVPCVVDRTNEPEALEAIKDKAKECGSSLYLVDGKSKSSTIDSSTTVDLFSFHDIQAIRSKSPLKGKYQLQNLSVSIKLIELLIMTNLIPKISRETVEEGVAKVVWPGRLQTVTFEDLSLLIDGAHNESAAKELAEFLRTFRKGEGLIFIVALSKGKNIGNLLKYITKPMDSLIATKFSPPEGMPWVSSYPVEQIQTAAKEYVDDIIPSSNDHSIEEILQKVKDLKRRGDPRNIVVCGSLYLCSDVLRLISKEANPGDKK